MKIKRRAVFKDAQGITFLWHGKFNHMGLRLIRQDTGAVVHRKNDRLITVSSNF
jgi:hypothetical protein